jgi:hypothetical protein
MTTKTCPRCLGLSLVPAYKAVRYGEFPARLDIVDVDRQGITLGVMVECPDCNGRGTVDDLGESP